MDSKCIVPIDTGERLKFPLHKPILLFMLNGKILCCKIIYAGRDFVTVTDVQERKITDSGKIMYVDLYLQNDVVFKRNRVDGYSLLENDEIGRTRNKTETTIVKFQQKKR
jgi:hypothetical protein